MSESTQNQNGEVRQKIENLYSMSKELTDVSNALEVDLECVLKRPENDENAPIEKADEINTLLGSQLYELLCEIDDTKSFLNNIRNRLDL